MFGVDDPFVVVTAVLDRLLLLVLAPDAAAAEVDAALLFGEACGEDCSLRWSLSFSK